MSQEHADQADAEQFCRFFRRSRYDIVQARTALGWGAVYSFVPCDVRAAKRAAQMLIRMNREHIQIRHARRARLQVQAVPTIKDVVVVTYLPKRTQTVFGLETAERWQVSTFLEDEALQALSEAIGLPQDASPGR